MYLFIVIFALASLVQDQKIKEIISKHYNKTWKKFSNKVKKESKKEIKINNPSESELSFFGKK